jgi:hypothetical protein
MAVTPPSTAASALVEFASEFAEALTLRRSLYDRAARDPASWRRAAVVVMVAALAADSLGLYSELDAFLAVFLGNWSLVPIMLLALGRWATGTGAAWLACRIVGTGVPYHDLLRPAGYAHAPAAVQFVPALVYWLDLLPVTPAMLSTTRWLAVPWLLTALALAALASGVATLPRAVSAAVTLFIAANLFDVVLDRLLLFALGLSASLPAPPDGVL